MINHKFKICKGCNQPRIFWTTGYCQKCSQTRKNPKPIKPKYKHTGELKLFREIWNTRPHICTNCQKPLTFFSICYFSHTLSKKQHPELRLDPKNIKLLCLECHYAYDFRGKQAFEALTNKNIG